MTAERYDEPLGGDPQQRSSLRNVYIAGHRFGLGRWVIGGGALIVALGGFWIYNHGGDGTATVATPPVSVRVATVRQGNMPVVERAIGTVMADSMVQVTAMVPGPLAAAYFTEGQLVKQGDLLFQIDPRPFQAALNQANGQLIKDQAVLAGGQRDLKRYQSLMAVKAGTQQALDDQLATVGSEEGVVESDKANVETARLNLGYTQIRAPIDGKTGPIMIQPGNVISVTGTTSGTTPLVTITRIHPVKISFSLPQSDLPRIQARQASQGLTALIDMRSAGGQAVVAPVNFIGNTVNNQTGTIEMRLALENANSALVPGQVVDVTVELNNIAHALIVPHEAVNDSPDGPYVYAIAAGRAVLRRVKVLFDDSHNVAVTGDLKAGDKVVVDGQLRLVPDAPVLAEAMSESDRGAAITDVPE